MILSLLRHSVRKLGRVILYSRVHDGQVETVNKYTQNNYS